MNFNKDESLAFSFRTKFFIVSASLLALIIASTLPQATAGPKPPRAPSNAVRKFYPFKAQETLSGLLRRHGFSESQIVATQRSGLLPKGLSLANGESYRVQIAPGDRRYAEVKIYEPVRDLAYIFWRQGDAAGAVLREEKFKTRERTVRGTIHGGLLGSVMKVLPYEWAAHRFMDAYTFDYNLPRVLQRGAAFKIRIETKWDGPDMIGYGEILETSLQIAGRTARRFFVRYEGGGTFVDPENPSSARPLYSPVSYLRVSSLYSPRRFHPIKNRRQPHLGIDFELPEGTDVFSVESGVVLRSGRQRAAGNFVVVRHNNGLESYYNHLHEIAPGIYPGVRVSNGQKLGTIGCTGYCTKAHLHFAVKRLGAFVDPLKFVRPYPYASQKLISRLSDD